MSIRAKLSGAFFLMALLAPVLGGLALDRIRTVHGTVNNLADGAVPRLQRANELGQIQRDQQIAALSYVGSGKAEDRRAYVERLPQFDSQLAELDEAETSAQGAEFIKNISEERARFTRAGAQLLTARVTRDRNFENLRSKQGEMVQELNSIRRRFVPTSANPIDPAPLTPAVRSAVNDVLLGTEGMLHIVGLEFSLATGYTVAPDDGLREQFNGSGPLFTSWLEIADKAGGPEDRAILSRVETKFREFEASARAMMAAADLSTKSRVTFTEASDTVNANLSGYSDWQAGEMAKARSSSNAAVTDAQRGTIIIALIGFVLAAVLGYWFAGTITKPIRSLRNAAERISKGDLQNVEIDVKGNDEIADLSHAFRRMMVSVRFLLAREQEQEQEDDMKVSRSVAS